MSEKSEKRKIIEKALKDSNASVVSRDHPIYKQPATIQFLKKSSKISEKTKKK